MTVPAGPVVPRLVGDGLHEEQPAAVLGDATGAGLSRHDARRRAAVPANARPAAVALVLDLDADAIVADNDPGHEGAALVPAGRVPDGVGDELGSDQLAVVKTRTSGQHAPDQLPRGRGACGDTREDL